ncbi:MAG: aminotransferase class V-fold PLP-dependent enzyme [Waddliaceae bacterium]
MTHIYLDNSTLTRPSDEAVSEMLPYFSNAFESYHAPYTPFNLCTQVKKSYEKIYSFLGANPEDSVILTSSNAEAINQVLLSAYFDLAMPTGKNQIIFMSSDEAPFLMGANRLEKLGCICKMLDGVPTAEKIADIISPRTSMISLSWGNGLTGTMIPVYEIAALCEERGIRLHLDITHVLGKQIFDLKDLGADIITFDGKHLHAPRGCAGLWIKEKVTCSPLIMGGIEQGGKRAGDLDVPSLIALGVASQQAKESLDLICTETARLRQLLETQILKEFTNARVLFQDQIRLPHITAISFEGVSNEALLFRLAQRKVFASIGGGSFQQIGILLETLGIEASIANSTVSFSLSRYTTEEEVLNAASVIVEEAISLRKITGSLI